MSSEEYNYYCDDENDWYDKDLDDFNQESKVRDRLWKEKMRKRSALKEARIRKYASDFIQFEKIIKTGNVEEINKLFQNNDIEKGMHINLPNPQGETLLHRVCIEDNLKLEVIQCLIENGADPKIEVKHNRKTPLHFICSGKNPDIKIIEYFIKNKANLNASDSDYKSPFYYFFSKKEEWDIHTVKFFLENDALLNFNPLYFVWESKNPDPELIQLLIEHGANPNEGGYDDKISLHYACENKRFDLEFIKFLVEKGANVNQRYRGQYNKYLEEYEGGRTPLYILCEQEDPSLEAIRYLLKKGANPNLMVQTKRGDKKAILHLLCSNNKSKLDVIKCLIENKANVNIEDHNSKSPLYYACENKNANIELIRFLLEKGADIKDIFYLVCTKDNPDLKIINLIKEKMAISEINVYNQMLYYVCKAENPSIEVVQFLIGNGADPNWKNEEEGGTSFYWACRHENFSFEIIQLLLKNGANPNAYVKNSWEIAKTPLQAICHGLNPNIEILRLLIDNKADLLEKNNKNETALHLACGNKNTLPEIIEFLIEKGMDVFSKNKKGENPVYFACESRNYSVMTVLFKHYFSLAKETAEKYLLNDFNRINYSNKNYFDVDFTKFLLEKGINPNVASKNGFRTLLHMICDSASDSRLEIINCLLLKGANSMARDKKGKMPFDKLNFYGEAKEAIKFIKILIENNINPNVVQIANKLFFAFACTKANFQLITYLLIYGANPNSGIEYFKKLNDKTESAIKCLSLLTAWKEKAVKKECDLEEMMSYFSSKTKYRYLTFFTCVKDKNKHNIFPIPKPIAKKIVGLSLLEEMKDNQRQCLNLNFNI